jgi:hypothetical protein
MLRDGPDTARPTGESVAALMPDLLADLVRLVAIPSVSVLGRIGEPLLQVFALTGELFAGAGVEVGRLDLPDTAPVLMGSIAASRGAPTVLLA